MSQTNYLKTILAAGILALAACASQPKNVVTLEKSADPSAEITSVSQEIDQLRSEQVDALAPDTFEKGVKAYDRAKDLRADGKDNERVLEQLAVSKAWLKDAAQEAGTAQEVLGSAMQDRQFAAAANAPKFYPRDWSRVESDLQQTARFAVAGKKDRAEKRVNNLRERYVELERKSMVDSKIGSARQAIDDARSEGAKRLAPRSLESAEMQYAQSKKAIEGSPRNASVVDAAATQAQSKADRVLNITRQAKTGNDMSSEEMAIQTLDQRSQTEQMRLQAQQQNQEKDREIQSLSAQSQEAQKSAAALAKEQEIVKKTEEIRKLFKPEEADVFLDGRQVMIRLKGLRFPSNKAEVSKDQYSLLKKVESSIAKFDDQDKKVLIEGHTDSVGTAAINRKISNDRAESVKSFLLADGQIAQDNVEAVGRGFEKPISTNKTKAGRAENRRIDVTISAE